MRSSLALGLVLFACAPRATIAPPEAAPLPRPASPTPAPTPAVAAPAELPPAKVHTVTRDGHVVAAARVDAPCPWAEYSTEWKGLRLRTDREGCTVEPLGSQLEVARALFAALAEELGPEFAPRSFGVNDYPELYERVARAALDSKGWNRATGKAAQGSAELFVAGVARDAASFYPEVTALFAPLRLTPELSSVEKVRVAKVSETPHGAALSSAKATDLVPVGSIVWFRLNEP